MNEDIIIVTLSPQSIASIAVRLNVNAADCQSMIRSWLRGMGVDHVCDAASGADIALLEAAQVLRLFAHLSPRLTNSLDRSLYTGISLTRSYLVTRKLRSTVLAIFGGIGRLPVTFPFALVQFPKD